ncbi:MAG TPA: DUF4199 domain-containing protein [Rhizomicrobium sp.]|jgi:hypothetical protein|nr:DUF4199 domain-containing protein [Rhizomicrobium sp.]
MLRRILIYGLIAGVIVAIPTSLLPILLKDHLPLATGMVIGYTSMLVAFSMVFLAIKRQRDEAGGGVIRFFPALGLGLAVSVVASIFYVAAWELAMAVTHMDFVAGYSRTALAEAKASGASAAALAKLTAQLAELRRNYANPLYRYGETFTEIFPVGVLVSLISAALLRNSRFLPARRA